MTEALRQTPIVLPESSGAPNAGGNSLAAQQPDLEAGRGGDNGTGSRIQTAAKDLSGQHPAALAAFAGRRSKSMVADTDGSTSPRILRYFQVRACAESASTQRPPEGKHSRRK